MIEWERAPLGRSGLDEITKTTWSTKGHGRGCLSRSLMVVLQKIDRAMGNWTEKGKGSRGRLNIPKRASCMPALTFPCNPKRYSGNPFNVVWTCPTFSVRAEKSVPLRFTFPFFPLSRSQRGLTSSRSDSRDRSQLRRPCERARERSTQR
jgi:hypothetical protein